MVDEVKYEYSIGIAGGNPEESFDVTASFEEAQRWAGQWREQGVDAYVVYRQILVERGPWERHP